MGKIIQFRLPDRTASGYVGYEIPVKWDNPPPRHRKEPIIISVMPGDPFPIGHQDLRPLLQRDGLILLSWALWEDWKGDGSLLQRYVVTWVVSRGKRHRRYATCAMARQELEKANPERLADSFFYKGVYGDRWWATNPSEDRVADYLYLVAPFDLNGKTIPGYIQVLKARGSTVDFDCEFTLTKTLKSNAQVYLEKIASTDFVESL
jgi:hypothetical protein